ncbi:hypothetical protein [Telluribacter sp. SYSU D00476]|uniref:hypothetical protein n=1 Tax=Telluribacter sp. SYSU D00476 TaxID=2811430 RepID=UPI001FF6AB3B|nr:hypothetical protein [Telluribacter sp. SYSU D00476]
MKIPFRYITTALAVVFTFSVADNVLFAQRYPSQEQFGKNRIQYRTFDWKVLKTSNFEIYHYQGGTELARITAQLAETEFDRITEVLGYTPYNKVKIFLYNSPGELQQSNMGLATFGDLEDKELDLAQSRVEIAYTGEQLNFRKKLVKDIALLFVYDMLYGGNLRDALQSSLLLTLPEWFMSGIAAYIAEGWTPEMNDYMRDVIQSRQIKKPSLLTGTDATLIGQSIWNYIAERYGRDNISNILNLTRIIRTEQTSITSTLGIPTYNRFLREWRDYYSGLMTQAGQHYTQPTPDWQHRIGALSPMASGATIKISPDEKWLAYTELHKERYRVAVYNLENGRRMIVRQGSMLSGGVHGKTMMPLIGWTRNNTLAILAEEQAKQNFYLYENLDTKKPKIRVKRTIRGLDQITDMDISEDGTMLVVSADKGGQNDIYLVSIARASTIPLTTDHYDDISPRFVSGSSRRVVFASNRTSDSLSIQRANAKNVTTASTSLGIYEHDGTPRAESVVTLLEPQGYQIKPVHATEDALYYLSDEKGIPNLFKYTRESGTTSQLTNYLVGMRNVDMTTGGNGALGYTRLSDGGYVMAFHNRLDLNASLNTPSVARRGTTGQRTQAAPTQATPAQSDTLQAESRQIELKEGEVDTDNYQFDPDVLKTFEYRQRRGTVANAPTTVPKSRRRENIAVRGPYDYRGLFIANDATSDWRIDPLRGFGYAQSISMNDLLENHVIKAGFFVSTTFRNSDLFAEYSNNTYRVDFGARVDRRSLFVDAENSNQKYRFNQVRLTASYPFTVNTRVSVSPTYTVTRMIDLYQHAEPDLSTQYGGVISEFVFDNSRVNGMNMIEGTRFKIRYENQLGISDGSESFNRISLDLRRYQKIHRDLILAARFAFSHSGGRSPKQSIMGGMENWILNRKENRTTNNPLNFGPGIDNRDVFFSEFATNLRGFNLNRLSGTSYVLANAELRIPLIKYIYRGPITSNFLRNFQFIGFTDIGTAWTGKGPFSQENSLNTEIIGGGSDPFRATVTNFRNPYLMGYGVGARTMLFGFYVKFDYAWGVDNGLTNKAVPYITLGYDF